MHQNQNGMRGLSYTWLALFHAGDGHLFIVTISETGPDAPPLVFYLRCAAPHASVACDTSAVPPR